MGHENFVKAEAYISSLLEQAESAKAIGLQKLFLVGLPKALPLSSSPENARILLPDQYKTYENPKEIDEETLHELIDAYRRVFGDDEIDRKTGEVIWGEGWSCPNCKRSIPLSHSNEGHLCPHCNEGILEPFYPPDKLKERLTRELSSSEDIKPRIGIIEANGEIAGFVECCVGSWDSVASRIIESRFQENEAEGMALMTKVRQALELRNANLGMVLYEDEMGIVREGRNGENYRESIRGGFYNLARIAFEHGVYEGAKEAVFWTSRKSQVYKLARIYGFEPIIESSDYMFLYHSDIESLLKIQQNISLNTIEKFTR